VRTFRRIAFGALLVSFIPLLVVASGNLNGNRPTAMALAVLHIAAYVPCVTLLPRLAGQTTRATPEPTISARAVSNHSTPDRDA
jgi:hypothetical protein